VSLHVDLALTYVGGCGHQPRIPPMLAVRNGGFRVTAGSGSRAPIDKVGLTIVLLESFFERFMNSLFD
jgi:hypothetical protein